MKEKELEDLISQAEAARLRSVTPVAIVDLIRRGRLQTVEIAGRKLLKRSDVLNFKVRQGGRPRNLSGDNKEQTGRPKGKR
jgi:hypothetical protein